MKEKKSMETMEHILFECERYERFRRYWKGFLLLHNEGRKWDGKYIGILESSSRG